MIYKFAIVYSIFFIVFLLNLVKKNKLDEKYSIIWLFFSVVIIVVSLFPQILDTIALFFDVYYPPSLLLLFSVIILSIYILHIILIITRQNKMIIKLSQELSLLKESLDSFRKEDKHE